MAVYWFICAILYLLGGAGAEDPYRFFTWNVTYGDIYPSVSVNRFVKFSPTWLCCFCIYAYTGILINGQFPGPDIYSVTNENLIINVFNSLPEPFLISWNGIQQRRNSYQDGVYGTNCPIPPGKNFTYTLQAAGSLGGIRILSRPLIPVPFPDPAGDFTLLIGDWHKTNHKTLSAILDRGHKLPFPNAILINGRGPNAASFTVEPGKTYRLRISNVGLQNTLNFRIQGHDMKLVESYSVLVTADKAPQDYYIAVSTRFRHPSPSTTAVLHYSNSKKPVSGSPPAATTTVDWSLNQARSIRTNLTASGPRPNPQGSYHYGTINITRTIKLANSAAQVNGKQRYGVNSVSFVPADTPLKLADHFNIAGVYRINSIPDHPTGAKMHLDTSVMQADYRAFVEVVFENHENIVQSWHLDGYSFFVVGMDGGQWDPSKRNQYNLIDAVSRSTTQVYPKSWTAVYIALDNVGMWNLRSEFWARQYLGQQFYLRVYTTSQSIRDEYPIPKNALLCATFTIQLANATIPAIYIFGDSPADVGSNSYIPGSKARADFPFNGVDFTHSRPTGRFSNGLNSADFLAKLMGFKRSPQPYLFLLSLPSGLKRHKHRGVNFASGGAGLLDVTNEAMVIKYFPTNMFKLNLFGAFHFKMSFLFTSSTHYLSLSITGPNETETMLSKSLFCISVGSNDIFSYFSSNRTIPPDLFIANLMLQYEAYIKTLYNFGARKFGIISIPPIGCCPAQKLFNATGGCLEGMNDFARAFHFALDNLLRKISSELPEMKYSLEIPMK
ncbi:hypothetical protein LOK49_LG03G03865 [Camellia lanceoleosa]|uniref:Uncharacterized protein n=1 Tax=Camellia lanceoleosa TaxID=1840588 RepID=A0ACC0IEI4_9ERIC|nr:hypothetical protein LOK49_LG03G03865 [Camellia lanceoleosa]